MFANQAQQIPFDLARAILLADDVSPNPNSAADALRALRRALATQRGQSVRDLVREAVALHRNSDLEASPVDVERQE